MAAATSPSSVVPYYATRVPIGHRTGATGAGWRLSQSESGFQKTVNERAQELPGRKRWSTSIQRPQQRAGKDKRRGVR